MRRWLWLALLGPVGVAVVSAMLVYRTFALDLPPPLPKDAWQVVVASLRRAMDGVSLLRPEHPALARPLAKRGPAIVSVWLDGQRAVRVEGHGATIADAVHSAAKRLTQAPALRALSPADRTRARVQVDLVVARGPIMTLQPFLALGVVPGVDGLGARRHDGEVLLTADELVQADFLSAKSPSALLPKLRIGLDFVHADAALARRAALPPGGWGQAPKEYFRLRAESVIERPRAERELGPLPLLSGFPPGPEGTRESLLEAARNGGSYLLAHLDDEGRFAYEVNLRSGETTDPRAPYSLPRHAGTTYFLAQLLGMTHDPTLRAGVERALERMAELVSQGGCAGQTPAGARFACLVEAGASANLGSTALAVVALAEYRRATRDPRYDDLHRALVEWLLLMAHEDGTFSHLYDVPRGVRDEVTQLAYFSGEAALALLRTHDVLGDPRALRAAEKALDKIMGWYDFFAGQFFFGEEHWTCIAAEAAWPYVRHDRYRAFCSDYAAFLRRQQFSATDVPARPELAGAYGVTPFLVPSNTPVGSRSEAMISAYLLTQHHGKPDERIRQQVLGAMGYLLTQQIRPENDFALVGSNLHGGVPQSRIHALVRIDFVQHACSAMLRAAALAPPRTTW